MKIENIDQVESESCKKIIQDIVDVVSKVLRVEKVRVDWSICDPFINTYILVFYFMNGWRYSKRYDEDELKHRIFYNTWESHGLELVDEIKRSFLFGRRLTKYY